MARIHARPWTGKSCSEENELIEIIAMKSVSSTLCIAVKRSGRPIYHRGLIFDDVWPCLLG